LEHRKWRWRDDERERWTRERRGDRD